MSLSLVQSRALVGLQAPAVTVEVHLVNGLPSFTLVGLADVEVREARERVRSALQNSGLEFPHNKRITVNLAPADLPKDSGRLDLPIALGILAASGQIDASRLHGYEFAGELSLSGELRPVRGALAMSLALHQKNERTKLVLPQAARKRQRCCPMPKFTGHIICWMLSSSSCPHRRRWHPNPPMDGCDWALRHRCIHPTTPICPKSKGKPAPNAPWRSRQQGVIRC